MLIQQVGMPWGWVERIWNFIVAEVYLWPFQYNFIYGGNKQADEEDVECFQGMFHLFSESWLNVYLNSFSNNSLFIKWLN